MRTHNARVAGSNPAIVIMKIPFMKNATGKHFIMYTSLETFGAPVSTDFENREAKLH